MAWKAARTFCLGLTLKGAPRHPLRLPRTAALEPFHLERSEP